MIFIRLKGGLGNQMFQYALGLKLANQLNTTLQLDLSSLLDRSKGDFVYRDYDLSAFEVENNFMISPAFLRTIYKLKSSAITKIVRKQISRGKNYIKEKHFHFQPEIIEQPVDNTIYEGWFQSPRYFAGVEDQLRQHFKFTKEILPESQDLWKQIQSTNAVCLNVRRTDFLKVDTLNTTSKTYFLKAANYIASKVENAHFFVFSDDVEWCRENIKLDFPTQVIDHSHRGFKFSNYMQLMSACRHFIIPNSSFAWWAVWLNNNPAKIVVAPAKWFNDPDINTTDLVPSNWIRF